MNLKEFIKNYIKDFARITIVKNNYICYEGDAISIPNAMYHGMVVVGIEGLGMEHDLIIYVRKEM